MIFLRALLILSSLVTAAHAAEPTAYLFTYFTKNGEDGLHLAWSADGYKWDKLNDGRSYLAPENHHAFVWSADGGMTDLGALPGHGESHGAAINNDGVVTGTSWANGPVPPHAFRWSAGDGIEDLGALHMASVEFSGMIREDPSAGPSPFREVWNMTKPKDGSAGWLVAGVQALQ